MAAHLPARVSLFRTSLTPAWPDAARCRCFPGHATASNRVGAAPLLPRGQLTDSLIERLRPTRLARCGGNHCQHPQRGAQPAASTAAEPAPVPLDTRLALWSALSVMLMKGSPDAPRCGFSRQIAELLAAEKVKFDSFDILSDEEGRAQTFSNWPTSRSSRGRQAARWARRGEGAAGGGRAAGLAAGRRGRSVAPEPRKRYTLS